MSPLNPTVIVLGATGSQGGAVASRLLQTSWNVKALVRNLDAPKAKALQTRGANLVRGDWDDDESLTLGINGCDKMYLCLLPAHGDPDLERRRAERIVKIARSQGVKQVVASSSLGVSLYDKNEHVNPGSFFQKHLESKKGVENAISGGGFDHWTFIRPSLLMANFLQPKINRPDYITLRQNGTWTLPVLPDSKLAFLDHEDVGKMAVAAFQNPEKFHNRAIGMASELLTASETLNVLGKASGKSFTPIYMTEDEIAAQGINSQIWMRFMSNYVDLADLAGTIPLTTLKEFLEREEEVVKATYE